MFTAKGYTVPTTWDEMVALSDKIAADPDGIKPWCAGIESGNATGWPATDWLEEVVLRQAGPDVYDQWIAGKVKFNSPEISKALATVGSIWKNPKYVNAGFGDVSSIATQDFSTAGAPIQAGKCYMMQQANFYASNWTGTPDISENGDIYAFYEPDMGTQFGKPVEVGGEFTAAFSSQPRGAGVPVLPVDRALGEQPVEGRSRRASRRTRACELSSVAGSINQLCVKILQDPATVSRFDASDLMPAAVGSGAEWQQLTAWITGQDDQRRCRRSTPPGLPAERPAGSEQDVERQRANPATNTGFARSVRGTVNRSPTRGDRSIPWLSNRSFRRRRSPRRRPAANRRTGSPRSCGVSSPSSSSPSFC